METDVDTFKMDNSTSEETFYIEDDFLSDIPEDYLQDDISNHPSEDYLEEDILNHFKINVSSLEEVLGNNNSAVGGFRTEAITELSTEFNECTDKIYKYLTVILGSLLGLTLVLLIILVSFLWKHYYKRDRGKKVSRAESWRYESSIYVNPGRQKSGIPVYVPSPTLPLTQPLEQDISIDTFQQRISRSFNTKMIPEEASNFNTLERLSNEGSTRAASPQQTPLLYRHGSPPLTPAGTPQVSPNMNRSRHTSSNTPLNTRRSSSNHAGSVSTAISPGWGNPTGRHQRDNSLTSVLRGVDVIRCTTPGQVRATPSPTPCQVPARTQPSPKPFHHEVTKPSPSQTRTRNIQQRDDSSDEFEE